MSVRNIHIGLAGVIGLLVLLTPDAVIAGNAAIFQEYHTYGGTAHIIADAFQKVALIVSSDAYKGLFFGIIVLSFVIGGFGVVIRGMDKLEIGAGQWIKWFMTIIFSVIIYLVFVNQTDTMFIYDETTNTTTSVGGVPDGIITIAGMANKIETGMIELFDTASMSGITYRDMAGGAVIGALFNLFMGDEIPLEEWTMHDRISLREYYENCVIWEMYQPGATIVPNDLENPKEDCENNLACVLGKASHWDGIFTTLYSQNEPQGETVTCNAAWNGTDSNNLGLNGRLNNFVNLEVTNNDESLLMRSVCSGAGWDITNGSHMIMCRNWLLNTINILSSGQSWSVHGSSGGEMGSSDGLPGLGNILSARIISDEILKYHIDARPGTKIAAEVSQAWTAGGMGVGIAANNYVPIMKAAIIAIFVGMLPVLMLLIPTPLFGKVLGAICGGFCFLSLWGVADAVVNSYLMEYGIHTFSKAMHGENFGVNNVAFMAPHSMLKTLAAFGYMRTSAVMLAGAFSAILFKFGGYMLGSFVGGAMGPIKNAGAREGLEAQRELLNKDLPKGLTAAENLGRYGARDEEFRMERAMGSGVFEASRGIGRQQAFSSDANNIEAEKRDLNFGNHWGDVGGKVMGQSEANIREAQHGAKDKGLGSVGNLYEPLGEENAKKDIGRAAIMDSRGGETTQRSQEYTQNLDRTVQGSQRLDNDIRKTGSISPETMNEIRAINSSGPGQEAWARNGKINSFIGSPEERDNMKGWLAAQGIDTRGIEVGKNVSMGLGYNEKSGVFATNVNTTDMVSDNSGVDQTRGIAVKNRGEEFEIGTGSIVGNQEIQGDNRRITRGTLVNGNGSAGGMVTVDETGGEVVGMKFESNGSAFASARRGDAPTEILDELDNSAFRMQYVGALGDDVKHLIDANQTSKNTEKFQETAGLKASMKASFFSLFAAEGHAGTEWSDDKINQARTGHDVYKTASMSIMENDNLSSAEKAHGIKMVSDTMMDWINEAGSEGKAGELAEASINSHASILEQQRSEGEGTGITRPGEDSTLVAGRAADKVIDATRSQSMAEKIAFDHAELAREKDELAIGEDLKKITPDD